MSGGIKADHGERGRGNDETEEVGEFGGHGGGVVAVWPWRNCPPYAGHMPEVSDSSSHGLAADRDLHRNTQYRLALARRPDPSPPNNGRTYSQLNREPGMAAISTGTLADHMLSIGSIGRGCPDVAAVAPGAIHAGNVTMYPANSTPWTSGTG